MEIKVENSGEFAYLMGEFANIIRNSEKNSEEETNNLTFGQALEALKSGKRVSRKGWNGKGMFLLYVPSEKWGIIDKIGLGIPEGNLISWIGIKTADNKFVPWLASQADMLAEDWEIVE